MFKLCVALTLLAAGCGREDCSVETSCSPTNANSYQFCNGGSADDCYYTTRDGHKFHCLTCGDCGDAKSLVTSWCSANPARTTTGTTGSNNSTTGNLGTCGGNAPCPSGGGSYTACASSASDCSYKTSDGTVFRCNSCSDCNSAVNQVLSWCGGAPTSSSSGGTSGGTSGTTSGDASCFSQTSSACQTCCGTNHRDGANYYADSYITCGCGYCATDCNTAGDVCHGGSTQTSACANCLAGAFEQHCNAQVQSSCATNSACSAFVSCAQRC
jgi:hypothetical protein